METTYIENRAEEINRLQSNGHINEADDLRNRLARLFIRLIADGSKGDNLESLRLKAQFIVTKIL